MSNADGSIGPADVSREVEAAVEAFERAFHAGKALSIDDLLPADGPARAATLWELIHTELEYQLKAGAEVRVEAYLARFPSDAPTRGQLRELVLTEWELRKRRGEAVTGADYALRFPELAGMLREPIRAELSALAGADASLGDGEPVKHVGRYHLLTQVGSGAFGSVWKAHDPVRCSTVAIKLLHAGHRSNGQVVHRFAREARHGSCLRHPAIVRVFEAGEDQGTHYLVSEFVDGVTLADAIGEGTIGLTRAAEIIAAVADALHVAHTAGVVHRDIKPSNILLDSHGEPRLTDFGLAKLADADETLTATGQFLGTPAYMPPELATGDGRAVDASMDIYSLGAVLYELLTGRRPFQGEGQALLRQVLEWDPPPPRSINPDVSPDLQNICLMAMHKEPARRYPSAKALAADIRRSLAGETVNARPSGPLERILRWTRRNPALAGMSLSFVVLTLTGVTALLWQWRVAEHHRRIAADNLEQARRAVDDLTSTVQQRLADAPGMQSLRRDLLEKSVFYYEQFLQQEGTATSTSRRQLAQAHFQLGATLSELGRIRSSLEAHATALQLRETLVRETPGDAAIVRELADSHYHLGNLQRDLGQLHDALCSHRRGLHLRASLLPGDPLLRHEMAWSYLNVGAVLADLRRLGTALHIQNQLLSWLRPAVETSPDDDRLRLDLAVAYNRRGLVLARLDCTDAARQHHAEAVELLTHAAPKANDLALQRELAASHHYVGLLVKNSDPARALREFERASALRRELVEADPSVIRYSADLAHGTLESARALVRIGQRPAARQIFENAIGQYSRLIARSPSDLLHQARLAQCYHGVAMLDFEHRNYDECETHLRLALALWESLCRQSDETIQYHEGLAECAVSLGQVEAWRQNHREAMAWFEWGDAIVGQLLDRHPSDERLRRQRDQYAVCAATARNALNDGPAPSER